MMHRTMLLVLASLFAASGWAQAQPVYQLEIANTQDVAQGAAMTFDVNLYWTGTGTNLLASQGVNSVSLAIRQADLTSTGSVVLNGTPSLGVNLFKNSGFDGLTALYAAANPAIEQVANHTNLVGFIYTRNVGGIPAANGAAGTRINLGQVTVTGVNQGLVNVQAYFLEPSDTDQIISGGGADLGQGAFGPTWAGGASFMVVPEPSSIVLLSMFAAGYGWRRTRKSRQVQIEAMAS